MVILGIRLRLSLAILTLGAALESQMAWAWKASANFGGEAANSSEDMGTQIYSRTQAEVALSGPLPLLHKIGKNHLSLSLKGVGYYYFYNRDRPIPTEYYADGDLTEGVVRLKRRSLLVEGGFKIINWGEMVGPSIVDLTNPRDLREPAQMVKSDKKLASPMVYFSYTHDMLGTAEAYFAFQPPTPRVPLQLGGIPVASPEAIQADECGARWGHMWGGLDLKLLTMMHSSRLPQVVMIPDNSKGHFKTIWNLMLSSGAMASYAFDYVVVRGEVLSTSRLYTETTLAAYPPAATVNQGNLAVDFTHGNLLIGMQGQVIVPDQEIKPAYTAQQWGGLYVQYHLDPPFNISFNSLLYMRVGSHDMFHRESLQYELGEHSRFAVSTEHFIGDQEQLFVLLEREDRVVGTVTFLF